MFNFQFPNSQMPIINDIIQNAGMAIREEEFILNEVRGFMTSKKRMDMIAGQEYYLGKHDILKRMRTAIGEGGDNIIIGNMPNNRIVNNQYKKLVSQKVNYLLGKPLTLDGENKRYIEQLNKLFNADFNRLMRNVCEDSLNCGVGYIYVYYDKKGKLSFKRFKPSEIIIGWADEEHREVEYAIRCYKKSVYEGDKLITKECIEVFDRVYIKRYIVENGRLMPDGRNWRTAHFYMKRGMGSFGNVPIIPFKYNDKEVPLIKYTKGLQDALNLVISNFQNAMEEDPRNTILVLKNYDGENLGEFRRNLATYGAVKVRSVDGSDGGVDTLKIDVNADNYRLLIDLLKKSIIENGMGFDAKDDRFSNNPNQMNIQSMYSDIDLDANGMEVEYKDSIEKLISFINLHFASVGIGDFDKDNINVIFNRDVLINESEAIDNCIKSKDILSNESVIAQHPWVKDIEEEIKRLDKEKVDKDSTNKDNTNKDKVDKDSTNKDSTNKDSTNKEKADKDGINKDSIKEKA